MRKLGGLRTILSFQASQLERIRHFELEELHDYADQFFTLLHLFDLKKKNVAFLNTNLIYFFGNNGKSELDPTSQIKELVFPASVPHNEVVRNIFLAHRPEDVFGSVQRSVGKNGRENWLTGTQCIFSRDTNGQPELLLCVSLDITNLTRYDEDLKREIETYNSILAESIEPGTDRLENAYYDSMIDLAKEFALP